MYRYLSKAGHRAYRINWSGQARAIHWVENYRRSSLALYVCCMYHIGHTFWSGMHACTHSHYIYIRIDIHHGQSVPKVVHKCINHSRVEHMILVWFRNTCDKRGITAQYTSGRITFLGFINACCKFGHCFTNKISMWIFPDAYAWEEIPKSWAHCQTVS